MAGKLNTTTTSAASIDKKSILGSGSYGAVYLAHWNELTCAAKVIHSTLFTFHVPGKPNIAKQFEEECSVISNFRHPNIVQFLGVIHDPDTMFPVLLMELMEKSLTVLLEDSTSEPLPYSNQIGICHDVALAITYLHSAGFIHRDISSNNVLMKGETAKLTDLGVSVLINSGAQSRLTTCPGTEVYMPPNSVSDKPDYTEKIDCFSFGVLGVQILTRLFPQPGPRHCAVTTLSGIVVQGTPLEVVQVIPEVERRKNHLDMISASHPLLELFRKCLKDKESDRPSSVEICRNMAHLRKIEEYEVEQKSQLSITSNGATGAESTAPKVDQTMKLESSVESGQSRIEQLLSETEQQRGIISRLECEITALLPTGSAQSQEPSRGFFSGLFRGSRRQEDQLRELRVRIQAQERELEDKRKTKEDHLEKWDWLEGEYQKRCQAALCAQQSLEKAEDELGASREMCTFKDQRIEELENESAANKLAANEDKTATVSVCLVEDSTTEAAAIHVEGTCGPSSLDLPCHVEESVATVSECVVVQGTQVVAGVASCTVEKVPHSPLDSETETSLESTDVASASQGQDTKKLSGAKSVSEQKTTAACDEEVPTSSDLQGAAPPEISKADLLVMITKLQEEVTELKNGPPKSSGSDSPREKNSPPQPSDADQNSPGDDQGLTLHLDTMLGLQKKNASSCGMSKEDTSSVMMVEQPAGQQEFGIAQTSKDQQSQTSLLTESEIRSAEQRTVVSSVEAQGYQPTKLLCQQDPTKQQQWHTQYQGPPEHEHTHMLASDVAGNELAALNFANQPRLQTHGNQSGLQLGNTIVASNLKGPAIQAAGTQRTQSAAHSVQSESALQPASLQQQQVQPVSFSPALSGQNAFLGQSELGQMAAPRPVSGIRQVQASHQVSGLPQPALFSQNAASQAVTTELLFQHNQQGQIGQARPVSGIQQSQVQSSTHPGLQQCQPTSFGQVPSSALQADQSRALFQQNQQGFQEAAPNQAMPSPVQQSQVQALTGSPGLVQPPSFGQVPSSAHQADQSRALFQQGPNQAIPMPSQAEELMKQNAFLRSRLQQQNPQPQVVWPSAHGTGFSEPSTPQQYWGEAPFMHQQTYPMTMVDQGVEYYNSHQNQFGYPYMQSPAPVAGTPTQYVDSSGDQWGMKRNWTVPFIIPPPTRPPCRPRSQTQQFYVQPLPRPQQYRRNQLMSNISHRMSLPSEPAGVSGVEQVFPNSLLMGADASVDGFLPSEVPPLQNASLVIPEKCIYSPTHATSPVEYNDTESIAELGRQLDDYSVESESYLVVLIRQQYINSYTKSWTVIFTVCRRNSCCITPLIDLLKDVYEEKFSAAIFSAIFMEKEGEADASITLNIPEDEIRQQGYEITKDFSPCMIKKSEASRSFVEEVGHTYPPRCKITITRLQEHKPLRVSLDLLGTDDKRKFTLTNPQINPAAPPVMTPLSPSQLELNKGDALSYYGPDNYSDSHIMDLIIPRTQQINRYVFGVNLGLGSDDVLKLEKIGDHCAFMVQTFDHWSRTIVEPGKKTWRCVLIALRKAIYDSLAVDVERKLCT